MSPVLGYESAFDDIRPMPDRVFKYAPQVNLIEASIFHSLQQMGAQLEFPISPGWPLPLRQNASGLATRLLLFCLTPTNEPRADICFLMAARRLHLFVRPDLSKELLRRIKQCD